MTDKKSSNLSHPVDSLQIARLLNHADQITMSEATKQKLSKLLFDRGDDTPCTRRGTTTVVNTPTTTNGTSIEILRSLIENNADWTRMSDTANAWLAESNFDAESIAKIIELSYLHGNVHTAGKVFSEMLQSYNHFYFFIHDDIRKLILIEKWNTQDINRLSHIIFKQHQKQSLNDLEHLVILIGYINAQKFTDVLAYYQAFERRIWQGVREFGEKIKVTTPHLALQLARIAFEEGGEQLGISCLQRITPRDDVYVSACRLMERARNGWTHDNGIDDVRKQLVGAEWQERMQLLSTLLTKASSGDLLVGIKQTVLDYLNAPFKWLPQTESAYRQFSVLLVKYYNLVEEFPSIIGLLSTQCLEFLKPDLDNAFWYAFTQIESDSRKDDLDYWYGVAVFHRYINNANCDSEAQLWEAHQYLSSHKSSNKWQAFFPVWEDLYRAALQKVNRLVHVSEIERRILQSQLRVLAPTESMCPEYVEDYLSRVKKPTVEALDHLQAFAERNKQIKLSHQIELKRAVIGYYRNEDLNRLWSLSAQTGQHDLCWRIGTVLVSRKALSDQVYHSWRISGENRKSYEALTLKPSQINLCYANFSRQERRFLESLLLVGAEIPELIHLVENNSRVFKVSVSAEDPLNTEARKILKKQSFFKTQKKSYSFNFEGLVYEGQSLPPFIRLLSQNLWSYTYLQLVNSLGCYSWKWQPSYLEERLKILLPHLKSRSVQKDATKISRWIRSLSTAQRRAWQDLAILAGKIEDDRAQVIIGCFVSRLTTLVMPHHSMALHGLHEMTNSLELHRDLENWILSPEYSEFRVEQGIQNKVFVANEQKLLNIIKVPD